MHYLKRRADISIIDINKFIIFIIKKINHENKFLLNILHKFIDKLMINLIINYKLSILKIAIFLYNVTILS